MTATPSDVFRERVKEEREARGISQRDLAARLKRFGQPLSQPAIARIERGTRKVTLDEAVAIAAALRVSLERLYAVGPTWEDELVRRAEAGRTPTRKEKR